MAKSRKIDASQVEELAFIGSTLTEMAILLNCTEENLYRRFIGAIKKGIVSRTIYLRRQQFILAVKGNAAAPHWFWESCLAQTNGQWEDLQRYESEKKDLKSLSDEELFAQAVEVRDTAASCVDFLAARKAAVAAATTEANFGSVSVKLSN